MTLDELKAGLDAVNADDAARVLADADAATAKAAAEQAATLASVAGDTARIAMQKELTERDALVLAIQESFPSPAPAPAPAGG